MTYDLDINVPPRSQFSAAAQLFELLECCNVESIPGGGGPAFGERDFPALLKESLLHKIKSRYDWRARSQQGIYRLPTKWAVRLHIYHGASRMWHAGS